MCLENGTLSLTPTEARDQSKTTLPSVEPNLSAKKIHASIGQLPPLPLSSLKDEEDSTLSNLSHRYPSATYPQETTYASVIKQIFDKISYTMGYPITIQAPKTEEIQHWIEDGYPLEELLTEKRFPWKEIALIPHPVLMEQVLILEKFLHSADGNTKAEILMRHILEITKSTTENPFENLSKIIFALEHYPKEFHKTVNLMTSKTTLIKKADEFCSQAFTECKERLVKHYQLHQNSRVQSAELAFQQKLIAELAELITNESGYLNIGLIDSAWNALYSAKEQQPSLAKKSIIDRLSYIQESPTLRKSLSSIEPPSSPRAHSHTIIKASLGLAANVNPRRKEAVQTALMAFLSYLRQGPAGSCFATSIAINLLAITPEKCVADFSQLILKDTVERAIDGVEVDVPYLFLKKNGETLQTVQINAQGRLKDSDLQLWELPGISAAAIILGFEQPSQIISQWLLEQNNRLIPPSDSSSVQLGELLSFLAMRAKKTLYAKDPISVGELYAKALFAFEAQTTNPLLQCWENSLCSMAETQNDGVIRSAFFNATQEAVMTFVDGQIGNKEHPLRKNIAYTFYKTLKKATRISYDPYLGKKNLDTTLNKGGFVLYNRLESLKRDLGERLDTPEAYRLFISKIWNLALEEIPKPTNEEEAALLQKLHTTVAQSIQEDDRFLIQAVRSFSSFNESLQSVSDIAQLKQTPWLTYSGNNPKKVLNTYLENDAEIITERFVPWSAENLLTKVASISMQRVNAAEHSSEKASNPNVLTPMRIPGVHSFSLMAGHPSLTRVWKEAKTPQEWMEHFIMQPGKFIAATPVDKKTFGAIVKYVTQELLSGEDCNLFLKSVPKIPNDLTFKELHNEINALIQPLDPLAVGWRMRHLDNFLCSQLPDEQKEIFEKMRIHFADTNWREEAYDVHLCFVFNPGTARLEVWKCREDGSTLKPLDQNGWLRQQEWEFYRSIPKLFSI